ncbi:hypothetical protein ACFL1G_11210 [Planctomycetota bacterium]
MSNQPRVAKVLATLLVSMTVGAVILMVLGNHPPQAGPFCLSSYYRLDPLEEALRSQAPQSVDRWERIEVYYSGTKAGNIEQLTSLQGLARTEDINFHFCICNGRGGDDGQIQTAEKWLRQWSAVPDKAGMGPLKLSASVLSLMLKTLCRPVFRLKEPNPSWKNCAGNLTFTPIMFTTRAIGAKDKVTYNFSKGSFAANNQCKMQIPMSVFCL